MDDNRPHKITLKDKADALKLLKSLDAPQHLIQHVELVGEAADRLINKLSTMGLMFDSNFVQIGVVIHDIGKILHPEELTETGSKHEPDGEHKLLSLGVEPAIARVCVSHAQFEQIDCTLEELLIALSDKLWKGKRVNSLEMKVVETIAKKLCQDKWSIFTELDELFEQIADGAQNRLERSRVR